MHLKIAPHDRRRKHPPLVPPRVTRQHDPITRQMQLGRILRVHEHRVARRPGQRIDLLVNQCVELLASARGNMKRAPPSNSAPAGHLLLPLAHRPGVRRRTHRDDLEMRSTIGRPEPPPPRTTAVHPIGWHPRSSPDAALRRKRARPARSPPVSPDHSRTLTAPPAPATPPPPRPADPPLRSRLPHLPGQLRLNITRRSVLVSIPPPSCSYRVFAGNNTRLLRRVQQHLVRHDNILMHPQRNPRHRRRHVVRVRQRSQKIAARARSNTSNRFRAHASTISTAVSPGRSGARKSIPATLRQRRYVLPRDRLAPRQRRRITPHLRPRPAPNCAPGSACARSTAAPT